MDQKTPAALQSLLASDVQLQSALARATDAPQVADAIAAAAAAQGLQVDANSLLAGLRSYAGDELIEDAQLEAIAGGGFWGDVWKVVKKSANGAIHGVLT